MAEVSGTAEEGLPENKQNEGGSPKGSGGESRACRILQEEIKLFKIKKHELWEL